MDHDRYGLDGMPIYSRGVDVNPVTGEHLPSPTNEGRFAFEPYSIVFGVLAVGFLIFFAFEAQLFG